MSKEWVKGGGGGGIDVNWRAFKEREVYQNETSGNKGEVGPNYGHLMIM